MYREPGKRDAYDDTPKKKAPSLLAQIRRAFWWFEDHIHGVAVFVAASALVVALAVLVVRDCEHPCMREGPPHDVTTYTLINMGDGNAVAVPITTTMRDCLERK